MEDIYTQDSTKKTTLVEHLLHELVRELDTQAGALNVSIGNRLPR
jgi:hypothetical protein